MHRTRDGWNCLNHWQKSSAGVKICCCQRVTLFLSRRFISVWSSFHSWRRLNWNLNLELKTLNSQKLIANYKTSLLLDTWFVEANQKHMLDYHSPTIARQTFPAVFSWASESTADALFLIWTLASHSRFPTIKCWRLLARQLLSLARSLARWLSLDFAREWNEKFSNSTGPLNRERKGNSIQSYTLFLSVAWYYQGGP